MAKTAVFEENRRTMVYGRNTYNRTQQWLYTRITAKIDKLPLVLSRKIGTVVDAATASPEISLQATRRKVSELL